MNEKCIILKIQDLDAPTGENEVKVMFWSTLGIPDANRSMKLLNPNKRKLRLAIATSGEVTL